MNGKVETIFIANTAQPMHAVDSVVAVKGRGLQGDRKFRDGKGGKDDSPQQELTLIEAEAVEAVNRDCGMSLAADETRRNVVTRGVALNHLVGRTFRVGAARCRGIELCEPCGHLEKLTGKPVVKALLHRGGLRAEILEGGEIRVGDSITPHQVTERG